MEPETEDRPDSIVARRVAYGINIVLLAIACVLVYVIAGLWIRQADECAPGNTALICSRFGQALTYVVARFGIGMALLVAGIGGWRALPTSRPLIRSLGSGWAVLIGCALVGWLISSGSASGNPDRQATKERQAASAQPAYPAMRARFTQLQQRIQSELKTAAPGVTWPMLLDDSAAGCHQAGDRQISATGLVNLYTFSITPPSPGTATAVVGVVRQVAAQYGFTDTGESGPTSLRLTSKDGSTFDLTPTDSSGEQFTASLTTACYRDGSAPTT